MALKKNISKSIRISEEIFEYIDNAPGKGFNEKIENIILEAKAEEPKRREALAELERRVEQERRNLSRLLSQRRDLDEFFRVFLRIRRDVESIRESLDRAMADGGMEVEPVDNDD